MTWTTRGSLARASFSTLPSSSTLAVLSSVAMGSRPGYSERLCAILGALARTRLLWAAPEMERTVRAASSSEASEHLAKTASTKPILVLCYNEPLAVKLNAWFAAKGLADRVHARNFHKWCRQQLVAYGQTLPAQGTRTETTTYDAFNRPVKA